MSATRNRLYVIGVAIVLLLSVLAIGATAPALADDEPPEIPASYYGDVTIDGEPAPAGTTVTAVVDGEERGSITVDEPGQYGDTTRDGDLLEVPGSSSDGEVTFLVNGAETGTDPSTVEWASGDVRQVDLEADDVGTPSLAVEIDESESTTSVEPNGTATVVAEIENVGDAAGVTDVEFAVDGSLESEREDVSLDVDETEPVAFEHVFDGDGTVNATVSTVDDTAEVTLVADDDPAPPPLPAPEPDPAPSAFEVTNAELDETAIEAGESVTLTATVENVGEEAGTFTATLVVDGDVVEEQDLTLEAGASEDVTVTERFDASGEYELAFDDVDLGTVVVTDGNVSDVAVDETELEAGESATVTATVENVGDVDGTVTAELLVDGVVVDERELDLAAGDRENVTFTEPFEEPGEYEVTVGDADVTTVTVTDADVDDDDGDSVPGFGATTAVVALLVIALFARRR